MIVDLGRDGETARDVSHGVSLLLRSGQTDWMNNDSVAVAALDEYTPTTHVSLVNVHAVTSVNDLVVLLDSSGRPTGTARKSTVHTDRTPLHLALSCYVVRADGRVLLTRRSSSKRTFPGVWTNACCGHPRPGEAVDDAVRRHLRDELRIRPDRLRLALPDFTYRAEMANGIVEHEVCPVYVASTSDDPTLDPDEADEMEWVMWDDLRNRASQHPDTLSPWSVTQVRRLEDHIGNPLEWVTAPEPRRRLGTASTERVTVDLSSRHVDDLMIAFMEKAARELVDLDPSAAELCAPIRSLIDAGGKRLRPFLVGCGYAASGGHADEADQHDLAHIGAAVEMLHTFALLHDDVLDRSPLRRGQPSAHVRFSEMHTGTRPDGDADWFGLSAALIAGDLAFVWADQLLDLLRCVDGREAEIRRLYGCLRNEVILGQYLDLRLAGPHATDREAQMVALLKSGRYTVTRPLELGAVLAGASDELRSSLRTFGDAAGIAFQLRDDVMGVFGDASVTGKGNSEDIRSGKASLLLVRALELASPAQRSVLLAGLGDPDLDDTGVDACRDAIRSSGAVASIERLIDAKIEQAHAAVADLPFAAQAQLVGVAELIARRQA